MSGPTSSPEAPPTEPRVSTRRLLVVGGLVVLVVAGILSSFASRHPDGLQHVAASLGFEGSARASATRGSPLAHYGVQGVSNGFLSGGLAGVVGILATALIMGGLVLLLRRLGRRRG